MVSIMKSALNLFGLNKEEAQYGDLNAFLEGFAKKTGYDVFFDRVENAEDSTATQFEIKGSETEDFLGKDTEVLDALGHLCMRVNRKINKINSPDASTSAEEKAPEDRVDLRVIFDSNGFRERRYKELEEIANDCKKKVLDNEGRPTYLAALGPAERKVIHTTVAEMEEVVSESIGNGYFKRLRIKSANDTRRRRDNNRSGSTNKRFNNSNNNRNDNRSRGPSNSQQRRPRRNSNVSANSQNSMPAEGDVHVKNIDENAGNRIRDGKSADGPDDNFGNREEKNQTRYQD